LQARPSVRLDAGSVAEPRRPGILIPAILAFSTRLSKVWTMSTLKKTLKAGALAVACGFGLCAVARKLKVSDRLAEFAHSVEGVPFPGAALYTFLSARQLRPLYSEIAEEIVSADHFERILDLDTGPGYLPIEIAKRDGAVSISGTDRSADMVRIAEADARAARVSRSIEFATGESGNLPFPGRYFDLVVSVNVLHHWPDPMAVFDQVFHILEPGGQFWIYDFRREAPEELWESLRRKLPAYLRILFTMGPMASWKAAYSEKHLLQLASQSHFEDPILEPGTFTLFGRKMPVFNRLRLTKPAHVKEES